MIAVEDQLYSSMLNQMYAEYKHHTISHKVEKLPESAKDVQDLKAAIEAIDQLKELTIVPMCSNETLVEKQVKFHAEFRNKKLDLGQLASFENLLNIADRINETVNNRAQLIETCNKYDEGLRFLETL